MRRRITSMVAAALLLTGAAAAGEAGGLEVESSAIALYVEEREPVGADTSFSADVGELACFSKIAGIEETTHIYHVWLHDSKEYARVKLTVRSPAWRTWSTKRILPAWTGDWKVEIRDAEDNLLETVPFVIEPEGASGEGAG